VLRCNSVRCVATLSAALQHRLDSYDVVLPTDWLVVLAALALKVVRDLRTRTHARCEKVPMDMGRLRRAATSLHTRQAPWAPKAATGGRPHLLGVRPPCRCRRTQPFLSCWSTGSDYSVNGASPGFLAVMATTRRRCGFFLTTGADGPTFGNGAFLRLALPTAAVPAL
jgi:hypothetical protein